MGSGFKSRGVHQDKPRLYRPSGWQRRGFVLRCPSRNAAPGRRPGPAPVTAPPEIPGHDRGTPIDGNPPQLYPQSMIDRERFRSLLEDERAQAAALVSSLRSDIASAEASRRGLRVDEQDPVGASTIF